MFTFWRKFFGMNEKTFKKYLGLWCLGLIFVYIIFFPIKLDIFSHYLPIYAYLIISLFLLWFIGLFLHKVNKAFVFKSTILILTICIVFPIGSYFINGKASFIKNSAQYNYPTVLRIVLYDTNQEELNLALFWAKEGNNTEIIKDLEKRGVKNY